jgi:hypothetical protein
MPTAIVGPLPGGEEGGEAGQPLLPAARQVARRQEISELLEALGGAVAQQGVGPLLGERHVSADRDDDITRLAH